jgi:hypothetical protein
VDIFGKVEIADPSGFAATPDSMKGVGFLRASGLVSAREHRKLSPRRVLQALSTMKKQITNKRTDDERSHQRDVPFPASTQGTATRNVGSTQRAHCPNNT